MIPMKYAIVCLLALLTLNSCKEDETTNPEEMACGVFQGDVLLFSQLMVDEFGQCNYTSITGNLLLANASGGTDRITDLEPLSSLTSIGINLTIRSNSELTNLSGLRNIVTVQTLLINDNDVLSNLQGLENLRPDKIEIWDNLMLESLDAFLGLAITARSNHEKGQQQGDAAQVQTGFQPT